MRAAMAIMLDGLLDYAGLFPPEKLPMVAAVDGYLKATQSPFSKMLKSFVLPMGDLELFRAAWKSQNPHAQKGGPQPRPESSRPVGLAVLLPQAGDFGEWEKVQSPAADFAARKFGALQPPFFVANVEGALPGADSRCLKSWLDGIDAAFVKPRMYVELPWQDDPEALVRAVAQESVKRDGRIGLKWRTGGLKPELIPSVPELARALTLTAAAKLSFKATAGLHRPLRYFNSGVGALNHGFLQVFIGTMLSHAFQLGAREIEPLLAAESPDAIRFDDEGVHALGRSLPLAELTRLRSEFAISFGCCSFDEPIETLIGSGYLEPS